MAQQAVIGVTGLGVMGRNLARNFARHGYPTAVHNRTEAKTKALVEEYGHEGLFLPGETMEAFVASLERPRKMVIMVNAGKATDAVIEELVPLLDAGDIVIDGGNAHFADTRRREKALREHGLHFVGAGISGGEQGALEGPSIMPGGSREAYEAIGPILEDISAKVDGVPCCTHIGPDGAGHFVKMVHNGIEYADMQLIAEAYDVLRQGTGMSPAEIAQVFRTWNTGRLDSYLIEITADVLSHTDAATGKPFVDVVLDQAEQKGTGRWTVQAALDLGVPVTGIAEAVFARSLSGHVEMRQAARELPGPSVGGLPASFGDDVEQALYASKVVAYAQGFNEIQAGSAEYGWDIDLGATATIWRGGCIIRARFLDRIRAAYEADPNVPTLLADADFAAEVGAAQESWRDVVVAAVRGGVPAPGFASSLSYYDALRAERLPAALIQAQRDFFGAHTYRRSDREGVYHTLWELSERREARVDV
ncbi:NADP-dependent phosphogluconate dehydrogenase [Sphaerisporangium sp. TRM90804]|uniref:NADP-dependent phosphogluconate dehydrogenase n=1 Tax=Sphaerisporangium sp. TRM90804 TaxID=3031113 RepID=UPI00244A8B21|nr:NADP-dependent phosphogluconate dehydrogenase [Sphaerisporangium sp. TRM90804]MDH2425475.1 NADP-dependent phosphogluconate dehydrogenase [Sphaerisporangium sp. TRM90804]